MANRVNGQDKAAVLLAPVNTGNNLSGLVAKCPDHLLPYGIIFEEYAARRPEELRDATIQALNLPEDTAQEEVWEKLKAKLTELASKYEDLGKCKRDPNTLPSKIDELQMACQKGDRPLKRILHSMDGSALCLSGGGIRSASFGLGVLEGLARFSLGILDPAQEPQPKEHACGLLHQLDYLSTVSGGGYIGSWLTAWIYRRWKAAVKPQEATLEVACLELEQLRTQRGKTKGGQPPAAVVQAEAAVQAAEDALGAAKLATLKDGYGDVVEALAGGAATTSADPAPRPVRHLREYTSYLAPSLGLSLDSWTLVAIVFRNLFVNWLMLLPMLLALVSLPQVSYFFARDLKDWLKSQGSFAWLGLVCVAILFLIAASLAGGKLPSHRNPPNVGPSLAKTVLLFAAPVMVANWILAELWWSVSGTVVGRVPWITAVIAVLAISYGGLACLCVRLFRTYRKRMRRSTHRGLVKGLAAGFRFVLMQAAALVSACLATGLAAWLALSIFPALVRKHTVSFGHHSGPFFCCQAAAAAPNQPLISFHADERLFMIFALPLLTLVPLLTVSLLSGLLGVFEMEEDREWWSRAGAIQLAVIVGWILAHAVALYSRGAIAAIWLGLSGVILGGGGSALGWSGKTAAGPQPVKSEQLGKLGSFLQKHDLLLPVLCGIALLLLTLSAAGGEVQLARLLGRVLRRHGIAFSAVGEGHVAVFLGAIVLATLLNWAISINLFSLHGMYRMRLMRAFLGASNTQRQPDAFTGFDPRDTPTEKDLPSSPGAPLHVINTTLNLVGTRNTAWRQRKAEPFSFSPLHSGSWRLGYVPTRYYAGADGPSLATALAISGAAFNPNMGYHSSPLVTLLMTFFNVRLGWWLPNPAREEGSRLHWPLSRKGEDFLRLTSPSIALEPIILEAFGMTDDTYRWIELTDGGHFENLGLYEMVLRRCKRIIVVDAGADPKCQFEDLGNALRKIEIDLGIPIRFVNLPMHAGAQPNNRYCAVATIDYGCVDDDPKLSDGERQGLAGTLVYIKAAITGNEPPDIKQYSLTHDDFPHETTANQFFNESQFESYRHLGSYEVERIVREGQPSEKPGPNGDEVDVPGSKANGSTGVDFESFAMVATRYSRSPGERPQVADGTRLNFE